MDLLNQIKENFKEVTKVFFENENEIMFLRIEVRLSDLQEITTLSRKINDFIDLNDESENKFYLDIYSKGTEAEIDKNNLNEHLNKNIFVKLKTPIKEKNSFEGELLENKNEEILIRWNAKGQFRKQVIIKENILKINLSAKIKKIKKVKNEKRRI